MPKTIDATPTWESLMGLFFEWIESGTPIQKETAKSELMRLAKTCDLAREINKD